MLDYLTDALIDNIKMLPLLFLIYMLMEWLEHHSSEALESSISRAGAFGPVVGSVLGLLPQCGFSGAASSLYSGRTITVGTLMAVFLSTSDEMLPIFLSESVPLPRIAGILATKAVIAIIFGYVWELIAPRFLRHDHENSFDEMCEEAGCGCEGGSIAGSAMKHALTIFFFLTIVTFILNLVIGETGGEEQLGAFLGNYRSVSLVLSALVGIIPNCASSVVLTKLYLGGLLDFGSLMAGLLPGAGLGLLVLFRTNKPQSYNIIILLMLMLTGILCGALLNLTGLRI